MEIGIQLTLDSLMPEMFRDATAGASERLVRTSPSRDFDAGWTETEVLSFERCLESSANSKKMIVPNGLSTKMLRECSRRTGGGIILRFSWKWMNSGTMQNGLISTQNITEYPKTARGCILSDILEDEVPQKYFLSREQTEKIVWKESPSSGQEKDTTETCRHTLQAESVKPLTLAGGGGREHHIIVMNEPEHQWQTIYNPAGGGSDLERERLQRCTTDCFAIDKNRSGEERDVANTITAREDRGVSEQKQTGTAVVLKIRGGCRKCMTTTTDE